MSADREEWSELDQASVRKSLHDVIESMPSDGEHGYDDRLVALAELKAIVGEEIARGFDLCFHHVMQNWPTESRTDAQRVAETLFADMAMLGLAVKHPASGQPSRLRIASTPPKDTTESWFELVPILQSHAMTLTRVPQPIPFMKLCEDPIPRQVHGRDSRGR